MDLKKKNAAHGNAVKGAAFLGGWYDQTLPGAAEPPVEERGLHAEPAAAPTEKPRPVRRRRKRTGWKVFSVTACLLLLIAASVYVFSDRNWFLPGNSVSDTRRPQSSAPSWTSPEPTPAEDFRDDFRAFFEEYYSAAEEERYTGSRLERAPSDPSVRLELEGLRGKKELSLHDLYEANIASIVGIKAYRLGQMGMSWGTGVVMTADGYIITNEHVIDDSDRAVVVTADGKEYPALLVGEDTETDIAVLKIAAEDLSPAIFGDSAKLAVGDEVVALGNPLGENLVGTMTNGIISAINRDVSMNGRRMTLIQTNAALNEGNSGGPLINMYGQVVGITNMKMVNRYSDVTIEGIGFAIPSATVKAVADQLLAGGEISGRPGLGITVGQIPESALEEYEFLPKGLYITQVSEGSDAKAKGVQPGDILTHVNGTPVSATTDVLAIRDACAVGDTLTLTLWRDGEIFDVEIVLLELSKLY